MSMKPVLAMLTVLAAVGCSTAPPPAPVQTARQAPPPAPAYIASTNVRPINQTKLIQRLLPDVDESQVAADNSLETAPSSSAAPVTAAPMSDTPPAVPVGKVNKVALATPPAPAAPAAAAPASAVKPATPPPAPPKTVAATAPIKTPPPVQAAPTQQSVQVASVVPSPPPAMRHHTSKTSPISRQALSAPKGSKSWDGPVSRTMARHWDQVTASTPVSASPKPLLVLDNSPW